MAFQFQTQSNASLSYKDFVPQCLKESELFSKPAYERFSFLIDAANQWLRSNPEMRVKTAESIKIKWKADNQTTIDTDKSSYLEESMVITRYIRALRLWLVPQGDDSAAGPVQMGYQNMAPTVGKINLSQLLDDFNDQQRQHPLPGRLINLETHDFKWHKGSTCTDPDETFWSEDASEVKPFTKFLRIFFEVGVPAHEEIACADFIPDVAVTTCCETKFEPLAAVVAKAGDWIRQNPGLCILNLQSIDYKLDLEAYPGPPNTQIMPYIEDGEKSVTRYIRIVRVTYIKDHPNRSTTGVLTYKTFLPALLQRNGCCNWPTFESMPETMNRIQHWLDATGVNVLAVETVPIRMTRGNQRGDPEQTYTVNHAHTSETYVHSVRLYLDGWFQEPSPGALPAVPTPESGGCCVLL